MFEVVLSPAAAKFYAGADKPLSRKLSRCFGQLERDPRRHNNIKKLSGELADYSRYRVGDWRVIFRVDDAKRTVAVVAIAHRRDVYE